MKKIPSLFRRDAAGEITHEYNLPAAQWVVDGEGFATRKWDGTAMYFADGIWWKRYDAKRGKPAPVGGIPCQAADPITGHHPFWVPVGPGPEDQWLRLAIATAYDGTDPHNAPVPYLSYEAVGPKIGGNPENYDHHDLVPHGGLRLPNAPRTFDALAEYLNGAGMEGLVWWRSGAFDCDKVKITAAALGVHR